MLRNSAVILCGLVLSMFACTCNAEEVADYVQFKIGPTGKPSHKQDQTEWLATFKADGTEAKFIIALDTDAISPESRSAFAKGAIINVAGSDPRMLMLHLAKALHLKGRSTVAKRRTERLDVDVAILGTNQERLTPAGSFADGPSGKWILTKLFFAGGKGEVYLNLDPADGVGEFSMKDEDYADTVMRELGTVL